MTLNEKIKSIMDDVEKIKGAEFCVPDNNCGVFVLPNGEHIEICGGDLLIALCQLLGIKIEWDLG
jgi:hypothetical protein